MLGCWWNAEAFVECQFAGGVLGWLVECYGACGMLRCWWNAMALVECQGAGGMLGCFWNAEVLVECQGGMLWVLVKC